MDFHMPVGGHHQPINVPFTVSSPALSQPAELSPTSRRPRVPLPHRGAPGRVTSLPLPGAVPQAPSGPSDEHVSQLGSHDRHRPQSRDETGRSSRRVARSPPNSQICPCHLPSGAVNSSGAEAPLPNFFPLPGVLSERRHWGKPERARCVQSQAGEDAGSTCARV